MVRARVFGLRAIKGKTGQPKISGGYTFVEVMIVLAVSALMFVAAMIIIGGQQNETGFTLAMQDLNSKIQNYVSQVKTSNGFDLDNYNCAADPKTGYPELTTSSGGGGGNCVYLGIALQVVPGSSAVYAYNVIGNTTTHSGGLDTGVTAETVDQANPAPAMDTSQNFIAMDTYKLTAGAEVHLATIDGQSPPYDMIGVYNALPNDTVTAGTGGGGIVFKAYRFGSAASAPQTGVAGCIEEQKIAQGDCSSNNIINGKEWDLCLQSADNSRNAEIILTGAPNGITSQLIMNHGCKT